MNTILPHSLESEQHALACMLEKDADKGIASLTDEHFHLQCHRDIFMGIAFLRSKKKDITVVNLYDYLKGLGMENVTSLAYVVQVSNMVTEVVTLDDCIKILQEKMIARSLVNTANNHIKLALHGDISEVFNKIRVEYEQLEKSSCQSCGDELNTLLDKSIKDIEERRNNHSNGVLCSGVPTGFDRFDEKLGGLSPSNLVIGAGRPGMGKTALILNMIENMAIKYQIPVGIFSLEMSNSEVMDRLLSSQTNISIIKIRNGSMNKKELEILKHNAEKVKNSPLIIDDSPYQTISTMSSKAIQMKNKYGIKALFIDYLQLINGTRKGGDSRYMEITEISRNLKCLAKQLNIPIVCLSQLSRSVEQRTDKTPQLSDLRDSGAIEQDADSVFFIYRKGYYDSHSTGSKIIIAKNRHGSQGEIEVSFNNLCCKFKEI